MPKSADATARDFNPMSLPGLSEEARNAVNEAFDAMSAWRTETAQSSEKNSEKVIEKIAAAARALGWPEQIVDAARTQLQSITKLQIQTMDRMMDAWEEQLKSPMKASPSAMLSKLQSMPGMTGLGAGVNLESSQAAMTTPLQVWMQVTQHWQKAWADAMNSWAGKRND
jgi:hypothetical protein